MRSATLISTILAPAADTDLTDLATVHDELDITNTKSDTFLSRQISAASTAIQSYCNRIFAPQTIQDQFWFARDSWPRVVRGEIAPLELTNWPTIEITSVVETISGVVTTLILGTDFLLDAEHGWLTRLNLNGHPSHWRSSPVVAIYQAGYVGKIPDDVEEAAIRLVTMRWFARHRDPLIRSQNAVGAYEASYVMGTGPGGEDDMPAEVTALIDRYRVPVVA
jgi:hypothetical protein